MLEPEDKVKPIAIKHEQEEEETMITLWNGETHPANMFVPSEPHCHPCYVVNGDNEEKANATRAAVMHAY